MFLALSGAALIVVAILAFIIIIGLIISLHELGHFIVAKKSGILCKEYSIGMGPVVYEKEYGETKFRLRAVPIGGFVMMAGLDMIDAEDIKKEESVGVNLDSDNKVTEIILDPNLDAMVRGKAIELDLVGANTPEGEEADLFITLETQNGQEYFKVNQSASYVFEKNQRLELTPYNRTFDSKKKRARLATLFAGPLMNFILGFVVYLIVAFSIGVPDMSSNKIGEVEDYFPAYGILEKGDRITEINGIKTSSWSDVNKAFDKVYDDYQTTIKLKKNGDDYIYEIECWTGSNSIGISNIQAEYTTLHTFDIDGASVVGLSVGSVGPVYKSKSDEKNKNNISAGKYDKDLKHYVNSDILLGIMIDGVEYDLTAPFTYNDTTITGWGYFSYLMDKKIGKGAPSVKLKYYHYTSDDKYVLIDYSDSKTIEPYTDELLKSQQIDKQIHYIGVGACMHFEFGGCIKESFSLFGDAFMKPVQTLKILIFPSDVRQVGVSNLSGVVGIFGMVKSYINAGIIALLGLLAMLSINIGIVNLLPIPALDGGRILFIIIEAITGKKVPKKVEGIINFVFVMLLMLLMVYVTFNDVIRLRG